MASLNWTCSFEVINEKEYRIYNIDEAVGYYILNYKRYKKNTEQNLKELHLHHPRKQ